MKKIKNLLFFGLLTLVFSSCSKCVECTQEDISGDNYQYEIYDNTDNSYETFGDQIQEICSDNFESKKDFNDYIDELEREYNYDCKSDFWN